MICFFLLFVSFNLNHSGSFGVEEPLNWKAESGQASRTDGRTKGRKEGKFGSALASKIISQSDIIMMGLHYQSKLGDHFWINCSPRHFSFIHNC